MAFFGHKGAINTIETFALSLFGWSDPFCDLFYAVLLSLNRYVY